MDEVGEMRKAGDTTAQRLAEDYLLEQLELQDGEVIERQVAVRIAGGTLYLDGATKSRSRLFEVWARITNADNPDAPDLGVGSLDKLLIDLGRLEAAKASIAVPSVGFLVLACPTLHAAATQDALLNFHRDRVGVELLLTEMPDVLRRAVHSSQVAGRQQVAGTTEDRKAMTLAVAEAEQFMFEYRAARSMPAEEHFDDIAALARLNSVEEFSVRARANSNLGQHQKITGWATTATAFGWAKAWVQGGPTPGHKTQHDDERTHDAEVIILFTDGTGRLAEVLVQRTGTTFRLA